MKTCSKCEIEKESSEFYKYKRNKDSLHSYCKSCIADNTRVWQSKNKDKVAASYKKWRTNNPHKSNMRDKRYRERNPLKRKARLAVSYAIQTGELTRPSNCESCFTACKPQGHHEDYTKLLEVEWLCTKCHTEADKEKLCPL